MKQSRGFKVCCLFLLLSAWAAAGCSLIVKDEDKDNGSDTDSSSDTGSGDADSDSDGDTDTNTDTGDTDTAKKCNPDNAAQLCGEAALCVDGYCCDSYCTGTCQACNLPGQEGTCTLQNDWDTDSDNDGKCETCMYCDGLNEECAVVPKWVFGGLGCDTDGNVHWKNSCNGDLGPVAEQCDGDCIDYGPYWAYCDCVDSDTGGPVAAGPHQQYGYCWYLTSIGPQDTDTGYSCDQACEYVSGTNLAYAAEDAWSDDNCHAGLGGPGLPPGFFDISYWFYTYGGNPAGWTGPSSGGTAFHTLGYGNSGSFFYGKCSYGNNFNAGTYPGEHSNLATRTLTCPCSRAGNVWCNNSLTTQYTGGFNTDGVIFSVVPRKDMMVTAIDVNLNPARDPQTIRIFYSTDVDTDVDTDFDTDTAAWTLIGEAVQVYSAGENMATHIPIDIKLNMVANQKVAFYVTNTSKTTNDGMLSSPTSDSVGTMFKANKDLEVYVGTAVSYPFAMPIRAKRVWNGTIHYNRCGDDMHVYSESFVEGEPATSQCDIWMDFRNKLTDTDTYQSVTIAGSEDPEGRTCSDPVKANEICQSLRNGAASSWECDGNTWTTSAYYNGELSALGAANLCPTSGYVVRPCISQVYPGNASWGGINGATCNAGSQTMTVICK